MSTRFPAAARVRTGKLVAAQPTLVDGIHFDSRLNAAFYGYCKMFGVAARYEQYVVEISPKFRYPDGSKTGLLCRAITWTPDFTDPHLRWVAEGKGFANEKFANTLKLAMHPWSQLESPPSYHQFSSPAEAKVLADNLSQLYPRRRA